MVEEEDELVTGLDSYRAGKMGDPYNTPPMSGVGPNPPPQFQGPMPPQQQGPGPGPARPEMRQQLMDDGMPESYTQNRMESWGMPQFIQDIESGFDQSRADAWGDKALEEALGGSEHPVKQGKPVKVDEVQMLRAGGNPGRAAEGYGNKWARIGTGIGGIAKMFMGR